jgi:hypothetical protein
MRVGYVENLRLWEAEGEGEEGNEKKEEGRRRITKESRKEMEVGISKHDRTKHRQLVSMG